jgi:hypothetical protein
LTESLNDAAIKILSEMKTDLRSSDISNRLLVRKVSDLLKLEGRDFIRESYRFVLKRDPDLEGMGALLDWYLAGTPKSVILASLVFSPEALPRKDEIPGWEEFRKYRNLLRLWTRLQNRKVLLTILLWFKGLLELPLARHQQQLEARRTHIRLTALEDRLHATLSSIHEYVTTLDPENHGGGRSH